MNNNVKIIYNHALNKVIIPILKLSVSKIYVKFKSIKTIPFYLVRAVEIIRI